ncbi:MAG: DUF2268 domain-containing putative Zn-dependent protease [Ferruginibacter sp.]
MRLLISFLLAPLFFSCTQKKAPDVSDIKISLTTHRFEKDLFSLDTSKLASQLDQLIAKYPSFGENFLSTILNTDPRWTPDSAAMYVRGFITAYRQVFDSSEKVFADFSPFEKQIQNGLQFVHYYFPAYREPHNIITYIGPLDGYGDILSEDALIVGLHHHLGSNFSLYGQPLVQEVYAGYITSRFEPSYIPINCMKNIVMDIYPEKNEDRTLVDQMVEKGKRLYILSRLLPNTSENMLIGYTDKQLKDSYSHEAEIWNMFIQSNLLQTIDNNIIKNYIGEGPKTQELGEGSPGNIGSFAGWQIVKKYMEKTSGTKLPDLMNMPAETIFQQTKYKP